MKAKITVESWDDVEKLWKPIGVIHIEIAFAAKRMNTIIESVGELTKWFGSSAAPIGLYRLGGDEDAKITWNGRIPAIHTDGTGDKEEEAEAAQAAALERN